MGCETEEGDSECSYLTEHGVIHTLVALLNHSLYSVPETRVMLYVSYTGIEIKFNLEKKRDRISVNRQWGGTAVEGGINTKIGEVPPGSRTSGSAWMRLLDREWGWPAEVVRRDFRIGWGQIVHKFECRECGLFQDRLLPQRNPDSVSFR